MSTIIWIIIAIVVIGLIIYLLKGKKKGEGPTQTPPSSGGPTV